MDGAEKCALIAMIRSARSLFLLKINCLYNIISLLACVRLYVCVLCRGCAETEFHRWSFNSSKDPSSPFYRSAIHFEFSSRPVSARLHPIWHPLLLRIIIVIIAYFVHHSLVF